MKKTECLPCCYKTCWDCFSLMWQKAQASVTLGLSCTTAIKAVLGQIPICHCDPRHWISLCHLPLPVDHRSVSVCVGRKNCTALDRKADFQARGRLCSSCEHCDIYKLACLLHNTHLFFQYCLVTWAPACFKNVWCSSMTMPEIISIATT